MIRAKLLLAIAALSAAACTREATQIIVQVDSNLKTPEELDRLETRVLGDDGAVRSSHEFQLPAEVQFPFSFGLAHDGDSSLDVALELLAKHGADPLYTRRAVTRFAENKTLFLAIYLPRACIGEVCGSGETCTQNGCESERISDLPELEPGEENTIRIDAGVPVDPPDPDGGLGPDSGVEGAEVALIGATGLSTTERGGAATFGVKLGSEPAANVIMKIRSSDPGEGRVDTATITVAPGAWTDVVSITARGVDDEDMDGPQVFEVILDFSESADPGYAAAAELRVPITNTDDETPGVTVSPTRVSTAEDGSSATFTVVLNTEPSSAVTIDLARENELEGALSADRLEFSAGDWDQPREVTVTGADDDVDDDAVDYRITFAAASADSDYQNIPITPVEVENFDDDTAEILIEQQSGLVTTEAGGTARIELTLATRPIAEVRLMYVSNNEAEGTVAGTELIFTPADWNIRQSIVVTGADDQLPDGPVLYAVDILPAVSDDPNYLSLDPGEILLINADNDSAGFTVSPTQVEVAETAGRNMIFSVFLNTQPSAPVSIMLSSGDPGEVTISETSLMFDENTWATPQEVIVGGVDDRVDDGDISVTIALSAAVSADQHYSGVDPFDVTAVNVDDDERGITVAPINNLVTSESDGIAVFTVHLNSQPTAPVTIPLSSSDESEGTVSPGMLIFTDQNWETPQTVTVTGRPDLIDDDNVPYTILTGDADSLDLRYDGLNGANVSVTNLDDDTAGIEVYAAMPLITMESGTSASVEIALSSEPTADVVLTFAISDATEGILRDAPTMTFTPQNWSTRQLVRIRGIDDSVLDGDQVHIFQIFAPTTTDLKYIGINPTDLVVINGDDGALPTPALVSIVQPPTSLGATENPTVNRDGRVLAFDSVDNALVAIDNNNAKDIFVFERSTLSTSRISVSSQGVEANGDSEQPSISGDGRYVVFQSDASNLIASDTNAVTDIFLRDRMTNSTTRVSFDLNGNERTQPSRQPSISRDGRYIVYVATSNLSMEGTCIHVFDISTQATTAAGTGELCQRPMISNDPGRWVVFNDGLRENRDTHRFDRTDGTQSSAGAAFLDPRSEVVMNADGRYLVISGQDPAGPNLGYAVLYLIDTSLSTSIEPISTSSQNILADAFSDRASISDDGTVVAFRSQASNLGGSMSLTALYSRLRPQAVTAQRSPESLGHSMVSGDGRFIVFTADTPVTGDAAIYLVSP